MPPIFKKAREGTGALGTDVTGGYELLVGAGNQSTVLFKSSNYT